MSAPNLAGKPSQGTDVAREIADVIPIGSDAFKLVDTLGVARRCRAIIMQNFAGALAVDNIGVGITAFGGLRIHCRPVSPAA
jgi:cation transport ATPase